MGGGIERAIVSSGAWIPYLHTYIEVAHFDSQFRAKFSIASRWCDKK